MKLIAKIKQSPVIGVKPQAPSKAIQNSSSVSYHIDGEDSADFRPSTDQDAGKLRDEFGRPVPVDPNSLNVDRDEFGRRADDIGKMLKRRITKKI